MNADQLVMSLPRSLRKAIILGHSAARADWKSIRGTLHTIARDKDAPPASVFAEMLRCCWKYGVTPREFLFFRMAYQSEEVRSTYCGKVLIKELHYRMNTAEAGEVFHDKRAFAESFRDLLGRPVMCLSDGTDGEFDEWLGGLQSPRIVAKPRRGAHGKGVRVIDVSGYPKVARLREELLADGLEMVEGYVEQHEELSLLYGGSVNTVRVVTVRITGVARVISASLKFGISGNVDNMNAGGRAAAVDLDTGRLKGPGITAKPDAEFAIDQHPVTGIQITGFQVPMWEEVKRLATRAAEVVPGAGTVGWDIAVAQGGPLLIEGNHDWGLELWDLPEQEGKREQAELLLRELESHRDRD